MRSFESKSSSSKGASLLGTLFVGLFLGILSDIYFCGIVLVLLIAIYILLKRNFFLALLLILVAILGLYYGRLRREEKIPEEFLERDLSLQIRIRRATVKSTKQQRRIYGFGTVERIDGLSGRHPLIYFNLTCDDVPLDFPSGRSISAVGRLRETRFGNSTFERYLSNAGIGYILQRGKVNGLREPSHYARLLEVLHYRCDAALRRGIPPNSELGSVYRSILLGSRGELPPEVKAIYGRTGMAHLFAISGLHIGIIAGLLALVLRCICPMVAAAILANLAILFVFVQVTGSSPSAMRAFLMVACFLLSKLLRRRPNAVTALAFSGLISLIYRPLQALDTSFQLSYGVVFSLLLFGLPLSRFLQAKITAVWTVTGGGWIGRSLKKTVLFLPNIFGLSLAATLPLIPLSIYHFGRFSLGGIILNPFMMNLATVLIACGFFSILCGQFHCLFFSFLANKIALILLTVLHRTAILFSTFPWIQSQTISLSDSTILLWLAGLFFLMIRKTKGAQFFMHVILLAICPLFWLYFVR